MSKSWLVVVCLVFTLALGGCCGALRPQATPPKATAASTVRPSTPAPTVAEPGLTLDGWRIAVVGSRTAADYRGAQPAEGHKYQQLDLLVFNTDKAPRLASLAQWAFAAQWQNYTYKSIGVDALQAYVPAGWPLRATVTFDLPQIVAEPSFTVFAPPGKGTFALPGLDASALQRANWGTPPPLRQRGESLEIPDLAAVTPTRLSVSASGTSGRSTLTLDATVKNLYGHDLSLPNDLHLAVQVVSSPDKSAPTPSQVALSTTPTWVDSSGNKDTHPLAPGMERKGSFILQVEGDTPASSLVLITSNRGPWALYALDDTAPKLLEQAIAPLDPFTSLVQSARAAAAEGNWVRATVQFQAALKLHPADREVAAQLQEAQAKSGRLLFAYRGQLLARAIAVQAKAANVVVPKLEVREPSQVSPDGRKAALLDGSSKSVIDLENSGRALCTVDLGRFDYFGSIAWAPGSDRLIATKWGDGTMMLVDVGSGRVARIAPCGQAADIGNIVWSPQSDRVAYRVGDDKVFVQNLDGSGCTQYTVPYQGITVNFALAWAPDGKKLYFPSGGQLMSLALDTANPQPVAASAKAWPGDWGVSRIVPAPDGRHLAILVQYGGIRLFDTQTGAIYPQEASEYDYALVGWAR